MSDYFNFGFKVIFFFTFSLTLVYMYKFVSAFEKRKKLKGISGYAFDPKDQKEFICYILRKKYIDDIGPKNRRVFDQVRVLFLICVTLIIFVFLLMIFGETLIK